MPKKSKRNRPGAVELVADHVVREEGRPISEVYGFVGSITTTVATAIYLIWAYTPEHCLHSVSITYYPSRYWALAAPLFVIVVVALSMVIYMSFNLLATPPPTSFDTIFDKQSRERAMFYPAMVVESPIEPISDISIAEINSLIFGHQDES
ncbi:hypothetical protein GUJ93_ZPchr0011g28006 [Zizania palustris]|uniref:Phosphatidylinositol N-acetylglucosaminyltransferase subunit P n=1 Tax=Zizania palustris TaxID=103762 RepID=A0A8J5WGX8_ZIZPA|nr:hypothetical protein GUJ93_ZPchr0011g28006 [Zizania palustris]